MLTLETKTDWADLNIPTTKVLMIDTETTGLPKKGDEYAFEQPWVIQLGALYFDLASDRFEHIVNTLVVPPEGVYFEPKAVAVHGFDEDMVRANGRPMYDVMSELRDLRKQADVVASYNWDFDERIVRTSSIRTSDDFQNEGRVLGTHNVDAHHHCVMKQSMTYFRARYKLGQVYQRLMGKQMEDAHDALADAVAAAIIMKELIVLTYPD